MSPRAKKQIAIESPPSRSLLSEALVDALLDGIGRGLGDVAACHRAGVSVAAYRGWLAWAEAMERGDPHDGLTDLDTALLVGRLVYDGRAARAGLQSRASGCSASSRLSRGATGLRSWPSRSAAVMRLSSPRCAT